MVGVLRKEKEKAAKPYTVSSHSSTAFEARYSTSPQRRHVRFSEPDPLNSLINPTTPPKSSSRLNSSEVAVSASAGHRAKKIEVTSKLKSRLRGVSKLSKLSIEDEGKDCM